jgi:hypothetical protein
MSPDEAREWYWMPPSITDMLLNSRAAALGQPAYVTSTVEDITGTRARTFREWVIDRAAEFELYRGPDSVSKYPKNDKLVT